jgi:hypothetical protein
VSVGPRGTQLSLGRKGIYYRKTLGGRASVAAPPRLRPHFANLQYLTAESNYFDVCRVLGMPDNEITTVPPEAKIPNMMLHYQGQAVVFLIFATDWSGINRFDTRYVGTKSLYPESTIHVSNPDYKLFLDSYPLMGQTAEQPYEPPAALPPWKGAKVTAITGALVLLALIVAAALIIPKGLESLSTLRAVLSYSNGKTKPLLRAFPNFRKEISSVAALLCAGLQRDGCSPTHRQQA